MKSHIRNYVSRPALFLVVVLLYVFFVLFYVFLCCSMYCLFCDVPCIVCVYMCTEQLPPGGYPIAIKYIVSYQTDIMIVFHLIYINFYFELRFVYIKPVIQQSQTY